MTGANGSTSPPLSAQKIISKKRKRLTISEKLSALCKLDGGASMQSMADMFGCSMRVLSRIKSEQSEIKKGDNDAHLIQKKLFVLANWVQLRLK